MSWYGFDLPKKADIYLKSLGDKGIIPKQTMITDDGNIQADRQIALHLAKKAMVVKITSTKYFTFPHEESDPRWKGDELLKTIIRDGKQYLIHEHINADTIDIACEIPDPIQPFSDY